MATPCSTASLLENLWAKFTREYPEECGATRCRARLPEAALACKESWSVWDAVTSHQVRASNLPLIYVDVILERISEERKEFYEEFYALVMGPLCLLIPGTGAFNWEQLHYDVVGRFIEKLMVLLRSSTMQAEEDVLKQTEAVERMYEAVQGCRVLRRSWVRLLFRRVSLFQLASTPQESLLQYLFAISTLLHAAVVRRWCPLVFVYLYLTGYVDKGGTLTCSSGSFQFRATFISVVLFEGAYVWIKFRDVASTESGGKRRPREDKLPGTLTLSKHRKPVARYTPPGQSGRHINLGVCGDNEEVAIKKRIAAFLYGRDEGQLALGGGLDFQVPATLREQGEGLLVEEKRKWVREKVREVYQSFRNEKAIDPASHHFSEDAADISSFLKECFPRSPLQEIPVPDSVMASKDVYNGAATWNELYMGEDGVLQEFVFGEGATVSCFLPAQEGVQNIDAATPAGVDFGMAESKPNVFAMMVIGCKDKEICELKQKNQKKKQKIERKKQRIQEEKQKNEELELKLQERDSRIAGLERDIELLRALTGVDPQ